MVRALDGLVSLQSPLDIAYEILGLPLDSPELRHHFGKVSAVEQDRVQISIEPLNIKLNVCRSSQISMKNGVLPRIHGNDAKLVEMLVNIVEFVDREHNGVSELWCLAQ